MISYTFSCKSKEIALYVHKNKGKGRVIKKRTLICESNKKMVKQ
jgi:hypothetical protein